MKRKAAEYVLTPSDHQAQSDLIAKRTRDHPDMFARRGIVLTLEERRAMALRGLRALDMDTGFEGLWLPSKKKQKKGE